MSVSSSDRDPVERLAEEFAARFRNGERPALSDYVAQCPERANEIRDLFPALVAMEQFKPLPGDLTGDFDRHTADEKLPCLVGDYQLLREVGRGGMGVVYEAVQISLGRRVALKVLPQQARLNPTYLERFRREAKAVAKLHHTNIVPVFGVGEAAGVPYYAMQFIHGEGLDKVLTDLRRMRQAPPDEAAGGCGAASALRCGLEPSAGVTVPERPGARPSATHHYPSTSAPSISGPDGHLHRGVARLGLQVADALAYAHRQGVLHRDVKPSNLLLDAQGTVWITDFGLAKAEGSDELTDTGDIVGTMRFMAPERFDGRSLPQSDVYALGLTLYEALTLRPAFEDSNKARLIDKVLHESPVPPRRIDPRIPRDLETVVMKCITKEPKDRYASADDLAEDLRRYLADRPIKARRASSIEKLWRWCRRNPAMASLSASVLLLLIVVAGGGATLSASRGRALMAARRDLLASYVSEARARRFSGRVGQRFGTLEAVRNATELAHELGMPPSTFAELRELAVAALSLPDLKLVREIEKWPRECKLYDFDERMEHVVRSDDEGNVSVLRLADNRELARLPGRGEPRGIRWCKSTSTVRMYDHANRALIHWNFETGDFTRLGSLPAEAGGSLFRHPPDGPPRAWAYESGTLELTSPTGQPIRQIRLAHYPSPRPNARGGVPIASHPYRNLHAISFRRQPGAVVHIVDLDRGEVIAEISRGGEEEIGQMAWMPDGRTLVIGSTGAVVQWDLPTRKVIHAFDHRGGGFCGVPNALGDVVTVSQWAGGAKLWHGQTGELLLLAPGINADFVSRGEWFLGSNVNGTPKRVWQLHSARECRTLVRARFRGDAGDYWRCAIHPNGRLAATGTTHGVTLLDLDTGIDVGHLDLGHNWNVTFDPATGDLITYGEKGLFRWPVQRTASDPSSVLLGPPRRLPLVGRGLSAAVRVSANGKTLALAQGALAKHAIVLHEDEPNHPVILRPVEDVRSHIAISPNGRWVATGRNDGHGGDIRVWDAATGTLVKAFGISDGMCVAFSPDGKWLVANDKTQYRFYHVGTWTEGPQEPVTTPMFIDWPPAFSPDGKLMALERGDGAVRLIDTMTGRDLAVLVDPHQGRAGEVTFSPDSTRLLLVNKDQKMVRLWDLRQLRAGLKLVGLDWEAAEYPMARRDEQAATWPPPLGVRIQGAEQVNEPHTK